MKINNPLEIKSLKQIIEVVDNINLSTYVNNSHIKVNGLLQSHNKMYKSNLKLFYDPNNFNMIIK